MGVSKFIIERMIFYAVTMDGSYCYASEAKMHNLKSPCNILLGVWDPFLCLLNDISKASPQLSSISFGPCFILSSLGGKA